MQVGVVGKPNVGKSTLFSALTLVDVPIAPYPFTTRKSNPGVAAVRAPCPHSELARPCDPGNSPCREGTRWVPVAVLDVPGLVPGAHEGRGLGHEFLDELRAADGFLHVVDASGGTTPEGELAAPGTHDPAAEVSWLEDELVAWIEGILGREYERATRSVELEGGGAEEFLARRLTGLSVPAPSIAAALRTAGVNRDHPSRWTREDRTKVAREILRASKPRLIAANKCDRTTPEAVARLRGAAAPVPTVPTCAEAELTLRRAGRTGLVEYRPGDPAFRVVASERLSDGQRHALNEVRTILAKWGGTGVQPALESLVFDRLRRVVVFPVEDDAKWTDSKGRTLPDAFLVPADATVRDVAFRVHTELGEHFIRAIDGRTHRALGADAPVTPGAVIRIVARR